MKVHFSGFYPLGDNDVGNLLGHATIVFDTDSLLDLFRMEREIVESILSFIEDKHFNNRFWLPYDVAWLYHYKMNNEILKQIENINSALSHLTQCNDAIQAPKRFPYLAQDLTTRLKNIIVEMNEFCSQQLQELTGTLRNSEIKDRVDALFNNKIGAKYEESDLNNIYEDGKVRYSQSIPPGYTAEMNANNRIHFHDLIVWKQLQKYAEETSKDILLITGNVKKDWYYIVKKEIVSPRSELINEFHNKTNHRFYCVTMRQFIEKSCEIFDIVLSNRDNLLEQLTEDIEYSSANDSYVGSNNCQANNEENAI